MNNTTYNSKTAAVVKKAFFLLTVLILLTGLVTTLFMPDEINSYENRYANKVPPLTAGSYIDGSFQDGMENALSDQIQFAKLAKRSYNLANALVEAPIIRTLEDHVQHYVYSNGAKFYKGKLLFNQYDLSAVKDNMVAKAENINSAAAAHPDVEFYAYYIEKDTDIDFLSGSKINASDYMLSMLNLPEENKGCFRINNFEEFDEYFYDTDHHWNYKGSYRGYKQILSMLSDDQPLEPSGVFNSGMRFVGSKALSFAGVFTDEMSIYRFAYPDMSITINGEPAEDYGNQRLLVEGTLYDATYGAVYGGDIGEIVFDTGRDGRNILVIGESYDNAVLKLLASHFSKTFSIDLRYYEHSFGQAFDFSEYVKAHDISKVLLVGNIDYYIMREFMI